MTVWANEACSEMQIARGKPNDLRDSWFVIWVITSEHHCGRQLAEPATLVNRRHSERSLWNRPAITVLTTKLLVTGNDRHPPLTSLRAAN
jgi:hypothetical protein